MVFSRMDLAHHAANPRAIGSHDDEKVFGNESDLLIYAHDFNMSESLTVRTHLVLAFNDKNALFLENAICLAASAAI